MMLVRDLSRQTFPDAAPTMGPGLRRRRVAKGYFWLMAAAFSLTFWTGAVRLLLSV